MPALVVSTVQAAPDAKSSVEKPVNCEPKPVSVESLAPASSSVSLTALLGATWPGAYRRAEPHRVAIRPGRRAAIRGTP
jgi:hypothetical protein